MLLAKLVSIKSKKWYKDLIIIQPIAFMQQKETKLTHDLPLKKCFSLVWAGHICFFFLLALNGMRVLADYCFSLCIRLDYLVFK